MYSNKLILTDNRAYIGPCHSLGCSMPASGVCSKNSESDDVLQTKISRAGHRLSILAFQLPALKLDGGYMLPEHHTVEKT